MSPFAPNLQRMSYALLAGASRNRGPPVPTNASLALAIGPPYCRLHAHDFSGCARLSRMLPSPTDAAAARWPTVVAPCSHRSDQAQAVKCRPAGVNPKSALPYLSLSHVPRPYSNRATGRNLRCFSHSCTKTPRPTVSKSPGLRAYLWEPPYHLLALPPFFFATGKCYRWLSFVFPPQFTIATTPHRLHSSTCRSRSTVVS
jgi:hypothetical protein